LPETTGFPVCFGASFLGGCWGAAWAGFWFGAAAVVAVEKA